MIQLYGVKVNVNAHGRDEESFTEAESQKRLRGEEGS